MRIVIILLTMLILLFYSTSCIRDDIEEFEDESRQKVLRLRCEFVSVNKATGRCPAKLPNDSGAVLRNINGALCDGKVASCIAVPVVKDGKISEIAVVSSTTGFNSESSPIVQIRGGGGDGRGGRATSGRCYLQAVSGRILHRGPGGGSGSATT